MCMTNVASEETTCQRKSLLELLPQYIVAGTGIVYATGFLVVLAFLDRFGLRDAGTDFWKARYIHIGILCAAFPFILNGTILSLIHLVFYGKFNQSLMFQRLMPLGVLFINLEIACFILIMVTDRQSASGGIAGLTPLYWILIATLIGVPILLGIESIIERIAGKVPTSDNDLSSISQTFTVSLRWVLVTVVAALDVWYLLDYRGSIAGVTPPMLWLVYIAFSIVLGVIIATVAVYGRRQPIESRKKAINVLAVAIIVPFWYLVILSFAYGVFQHIPATRGGGDYSRAPRVVVTFKDTQAATVDARYFEQNSKQITKPLVLIEESSWALYLADPKDGGGPAEWKQIGGRKPEILIVNKAEVASLLSESRNPQKHKP